ncbi:thioredoxin domain-containing protein [Streptomyces yaizuensis]|uniref:Redoxin domain-containing protein n=1 Tax=Streptomyces yaizuensis TaxID=2989713 RepID=A0ABQ5PAD2_9ACTN|nr:hypothetical protein [Streptomyces sp. YSPA8]GLF99550.1 redoxin domain-containing protein [Streptomyces sp. YSPA8]
MSPLAVAVLAVGALAMVNLVLVVGVVRRLREHSELLARTPGPAAGLPEGMTGVAPAGTPVPAFTTGPADSPVTDRDLADGTLVAFFSPTCGPCRDKLPGFVARYADRPEEARHVLAVVVHESGDPGDPDTTGTTGTTGTTDTADTADGSMAAALAAVVPTVQEPYDGPVTEAFAVKAFPSCVRVGHGPDGGLVVTEVGNWPRTPVPAAR